MSARFSRRRRADRWGTSTPGGHALNSAPSKKLNVKGYFRGCAFALTCRNRIPCFSLVKGVFSPPEAEELSFSNWISQISGDNPIRGFLGSEQESDESPDWRGVRDFAYPGNSTVCRSGRQMPVLRRASLKLAGSRHFQRSRVRLRSHGRP